MKAVVDAGMRTQNISAPQLAAMLSVFDEEVDEGKVRKWRSGLSLPPEHLAQPLARALRLSAERSDPDIVARLGYDPMIGVFPK